MGCWAAYLSVGETAKATASVLGVIAATATSLGLLSKTKPSKWLWRRLVVMPREERAQRHAEEIRKPILEHFEAMKTDNARQHGEVRDELSKLGSRITDVELALTAPTKENQR